MARRSCALTWLALGASALAATPGGATPQECEARPPQPVVWIVVVASPDRVKQYAATVKGVRTVRGDTETIVFADGRVVTANLGAVGDHLNALGWADREIQIVGSFARRRPPRRVPT